MGQFYQDKQHFIPKEVFIPEAIDEELVAAIVPTKIIKPQRGEKKQLVALRPRMHVLAFSRNLICWKKILRKLAVPLTI